MNPSQEPNPMHLYLRHCVIGFALSAVFVAMLLWRDVAGIGSLVQNSDVGALAVFLLWFFHGTIFGGVQFAIVLMLNADDDNDDDDDDHRGRMIPIRVPVESRSRLS